MSTFKVGEVTILQNAAYFTEYNGMECTILTPLQENKIMHMTTMEQAKRESYFVEMADGLKLKAAPYQLKKKPLPEETKTKTKETKIACKASTGECFIGVLPQPLSMRKIIKTANDFFFQR